MSMEKKLCAEPESEKIERVQNTDEILAEARRAGIDLDLLDSNLALSYEDRVLRHASALELVCALREAGRKNAESSPPVAEAR